MKIWPLDFAALESDGFYVSCASIGGAGLCRLRRLGQATAAFHPAFAAIVDASQHFGPGDRGHDFRVQRIDDGRCEASAD